MCNHKHISKCTLYIYNIYQYETNARPQTDLADCDGEQQFLCQILEYDNEYNQIWIMLYIYGHNNRTLIIAHKQNRISYNAMALPKSGEFVFSWNNKHTYSNAPKH